MRRTSAQRVLPVVASIALSIGASQACGSDSSDEPTPPTIDGSTEFAAEASAPPADGAPADAPVDAGPPCTATPCVTQLAAGGTHTCARVADGTVRCWGSNINGELASGTVQDGGAFDGGVSPVAVTPPVTGASLVAAGGEGQGYDFSCAVVSGSATCWGSNGYGQLARTFDAGGGGGDPVAHPDPAVVPGLSDIADLRGGGAHACALLKGGGVSCWGFNSLDQLARPDAGAVAPVPGPAGLATPATQIALGQFHTCALAGDGTVSCWGQNGHGQLGRRLDGALQDGRPSPVVGLAGVAQVAAGNFHTCALLAAGPLLCWGSNDHGQTGRGPGGATDEPSPAIVALPTGTSIVQVSAGLLHTCALSADGSVWCWGANATGAIGTGRFDGGFDPSDVLFPTKVEGLAGPALAVSAAYLHTCALLAGGAVECWGSNQFGELGRGAVDGGNGTDTSPHPTPTPVRL